MHNSDPFSGQCEVLVVGAGPAGSACAQMLAHAGLDVLLVDQERFPREKVCGDGLIPDAHRALARLGVLPEVMAQARRLGHVGCIGPRGGRVNVPGTLAVLPRRELDLIVQRAALAAGARWLAPARFEAPLMDGERVVGARLKLEGGVLHDVRARWTVLATGAVPQALIASGLCERRTPSGVALRGYVRNEALRDSLRTMDVVWHRSLSPGYGWIFPCRDGVFNVGVGLMDSHVGDADGRSSKRNFNLRELFADFTRNHAPARELLAGGELLGELKGAPLRCTLEGARWSRAGLLATGEAAGSTYSFTGEGIGKALETGMLAAQSLIEGQAARLGDAALQARYEASLTELRPRFQLYKRANRINRYQWLAELMIRRARKSDRLLARMSGVLEETSNPGSLVTLRGLAKLFVE